MRLASAGGPGLSVFIVFVTAVGCSGGEGLGPDEPAFGIGDKADGGQCDAREPLCWPSEDLEAMREAMRLHSALDLDRASPAELSRLIDLLVLDLGHRLREEHVENLEALRPAVLALPPDVGQEVVQDLLADIDTFGFDYVHSSFWMAQMVPIGRAAEILIDAGADGRYDDASEEADGLEPTVDDSQYSEGVRESLRQLRGSFIGRVYARLIEWSGVLDEDYELINAVNFGEYDAEHDRVVPAGLSREERVDRIVRHYSVQAGLVGTGAGLVTMVNPLPVLGDAAVATGEMAYLFYNHMRMVLEIAPVYGMDFRDGMNLYNLVVLIMEEGLTAEVVDVGVSNILVPLLARRVAVRLGIELPHNLAANLAGRSARTLMRIFNRKSQEELAEAAVQGSWRTVGSKVLAWATLGAAVAVSGALDWYVTRELGDDAAIFTQGWLRDLLLEGTTHLHRPAARDCAFTALGAMAWADGRVTEREARFYQAVLAKPYNVDEQSWFFLDSTERVRQSRRLASMQDARDREGEVASCLAEQFDESRPQHKLSLLAYLYGMMQIDLEEAGEESDLYAGIVDLWDGGAERCVGTVCWGGDPEIDRLQLDFAERAMYLLLHPGTVEISSEYQDLMSGITPEVMLDYMGEPNAEVEADFRCGFEGTCVSP